MAVSPRGQKTITAAARRIVDAYDAYECAAHDEGAFRRYDEALDALRALAYRTIGCQCAGCVIGWSREITAGRFEVFPSPWQASGGA